MTNQAKRLSSRTYLLGVEYISARIYHVASRLTKSFILNVKEKKNIVNNIIPLAVETY